MKKSIAIVCLVLAASILNAGTYEDLEYQENDDGTLTIDKYRGQQSHIKLSAEIQGKQVAVIGKETFRDCKRLKSIKMPSTLKSIGVHAFNSCTALESQPLAERSSRKR